MLQTNIYCSVHVQLTLQSKRLKLIKRFKLENGHFLKTEKWCLSINNNYVIHQIETSELLSMANRTVRLLCDYCLCAFVAPCAQESQIRSLFFCRQGQEQGNQLREELDSIPQLVAHSYFESYCLAR